MSSAPWNHHLNSISICLRPFSALAADPYLDTIPTERGKDMIKRIRERDGLYGKGRPTKRAGADTDAI